MVGWRQTARVRAVTSPALSSGPSMRPALPPIRVAAENIWVPGSERSYLDPHPCMRDAGVGRVLVASLHQGIADVLPQRLTFYESWLDAEGLREGTIGLAPLYAVLSFLRQEGDAYGTITTSAGEYAAEWTVESMAPSRRAMIKAAPTWMRRRLLMNLAKQLVRETYQGSRAIAR